jgi:integrase
MVYDPVTRRPRQVGTFATRREARRAESDAMDRRTATGTETIASFAARWPEDYPRPRASTNVHNAERVKPFAKAYEGRRMDSITVEEARSWAVRHRGQLLALRAMFNDARCSGMVVNNPFRDLGIERSRGRRDLASEWLTAKDVERLARCARDVHADSGYGDTMAGLLTFAAYTGLRPGELYALRHDDLGAQTLEVNAPPTRGRAR